MARRERNVLVELYLNDDRAADGGVVTDGLASGGIVWTRPRRRGRGQTRVQEGGSLKRCWRWKTERSTASLGHECRHLFRHNDSLNGAADVGSLPD
jgi:hypothetical protein